MSTSTPPAPDFLGPVAVLSPEAIAEHDRQITAFAEGKRMGEAGEPLPGDATPVMRQGWTHGDVLRRGRAGEVIVAVCPSTRCLSCGAMDWGQRLGCPAGCGAVPVGGIDWGVQLVGVDPATPGEFMNLDEIQAANARGVKVVDVFDGREYIIPPPETA